MSTFKNPLEAAIWQAGYVRGPNKIYSDIPWTQDGNSPLWYAGSANIPEPGHKGCCNEVQVLDGSLRVFRHSPLSTHLLTQTVAEFATVESFLAWCRSNGQISEPGLPAFSNAWD